MRTIKSSHSCSCPSFENYIIHIVPHFLSFRVHFSIFFWLFDWHTSAASLGIQGVTQCRDVIVLQICPTIFWYSRYPTGQSTKVAASSAVITASKYPQSEVQTVHFLLGISFLIIITEYIKVKGFTPFGYLTSIFFYYNYYSLANQIIKLYFLRHYAIFPSLLDLVAVRSVLEMNVTAASSIAPPSKKSSRTNCFSVITGLSLSHDSRAYRAFINLHRGNICQL